jgi:hypothetical protein
LNGSVLNLGGKNLKTRVGLARRVGAICALSGLLIAAPNTAAFAFGEPSGSVTVTQGPAGSSGTVTWDAATKTVRITTVAGALAAGKCVTTWWDWLTSHGHYDARAVRVCKSGQQSTKTWSGEDSRVTGLQKLGVCYGADNQTGSCKTGPGAVSASGSPNFCNWTTGSYTIKASGPPQSCSGGDPTSPTS